MISHKLSACLLATAASLGGFYSSSSALAQTNSTPQTGNQIETVEVTARRRTENLEKVPVAVTALNSEQLDEERIVTNFDLQQNAPSLDIIPRDSRTASDYGIRGLGQSILGNTTVTTYYSEVPFPPATGGAGDAASGSPLYDVGSVQVLRGPQGTLFGRATTAGAVLITPNHPDLENLSGSFDIVEGNYDTNQDTAVANVPIVPGEFAIRIAVNRNYQDGFTQIIGSNQTLDGTNTISGRLSAEWVPSSRFHNYLALDTYQQDQSPVSFLLSGYNPNFALFNLPQPNTFLGMIYGPILFGAECGLAVTYGFSSNVTACEQQRLGILDSYGPALAADMARQAAGGAAALRAAPVATDIPLVDKASSYRIVDIAEANLGDLGFSDVSLRNVFGYQMYRSLTAFDASPIAPHLLVAPGFGIGTGTNDQQVGNTPVSNEGPYQKTITEELQVHGTLDQDLLVWVLGIYYEDTPVVPNGNGVNDIYQAFSGALTTPNLGYGPAFGFYRTGDSYEVAGYGQFTLDLSRWLLKGLHLTGGYRRTDDYTSLTTAAAEISYPSGNFFPGPLSTTKTINWGTGWTAALDWQVTDDTLVYATSRRGYNPGGCNCLSAAISAANFTQTFLPETVQDIEFGTKSQFQVLGMEGLINADVYRMWYSNIQETFTGLLDGVYTGYTENAAAAVLQGLEIEGTLKPTDDLTLNLSYSNNEAHYTRWLSADPLGIAPKGTNINLANNPFQNAPVNKVSATVRYDVPLGSNAGDLALQLNVYAQSREWFTPEAGEFIGLDGQSIINQISQSSFAILNARVDWFQIYGSNFRAGFFVHNLTNVTYAQFGFADYYSLGFNEKAYAPPRMFGAELSYKFGP